VLPLWAEILLAGAAVAATLRSYRLSRRERVLSARLQARERESHFLGESPEPARILEIISPAGFEKYFEEIVDMGGSLRARPETLRDLAQRYGLEVNLASIPELAQRFGLSLPARPPQPD